jgi:hypothetical protein
VQQRANVFIPQTDQQAEWYKRMWNALHGARADQESARERNHFQVTPTHHMSQPARVTNQHMQNSFDAFTASLHPVDRERLRREQGHAQKEEAATLEEGKGEGIEGKQADVGAVIEPTSKSAQTIVVRTPNSMVGENEARMFSKPRYSGVE